MGTQGPSKQLGELRIHTCQQNTTVVSSRLDEFKLAIRFFENIKAVVVIEGYEGHSGLRKRMDSPD